MNDPLYPGSPEERLIVALDVPSATEAVSLAKRLGESVVWVKVGLELFCASGPGVVEQLAALGKRLFLDLKFHDIPNTVAGAVRSVARLPVQLLTMHAAAGEEAMRAAAEAAGARDDLGILAVTRLTSVAGVSPDFTDVEEAAAAAAASGLFGVVCPAAAAPRLRDRFEGKLRRVCPGIRPGGAVRDDQVHVATPASAVAAGADWIVVGRPITRQPDPAVAAVAIIDQIKAANRDAAGFDAFGTGR
jgi:orotidine-5'-phosphate decarboxylase